MVETRIETLRARTHILKQEGTGIAVPLQRVKIKCYLRRCKKLSSGLSCALK